MRIRLWSRGIRQPTRGQYGPAQERFERLLQTPVPRRSDWRRLDVNALHALVTDFANEVVDVRRFSGANLRARSEGFYAHVLRQLSDFDPIELAVAEKRDALVARISKIRAEAEVISAML